jgi:hypothetical protein
LSASNRPPVVVSRRVSRVHRWVGRPALAFALGMVLLWAWKQQLTRDLRAASADQQLERCLRLERRLQLLEWVPSPPAADSGRCRREAAERLWGARKPELALRLQQELVRSKAATSDDLQQLRLWKADVQRSALRAFEQGDLERALDLLRRSDTNGGDPGVAAMTEQLRRIWGQNKVNLARAETLAGQKKWWEALSALNSLTHPSWREESKPLRKRVEKALAKLEQRRVETHGPLPYAIPQEKLDALVRRRMEAGVPDWQAFGEACRALGGRVVDGGPEATCQP